MRDFDSEAELLFLKWKTDLATMDRSSASVESNFFILFSQMCLRSIPIDNALKILPRAIKAHQPSDTVLKRTWFLLDPAKKKKRKYDSFCEDWLQSIENKGNNAFFEAYPTWMSEETPEQEDDTSAPKMYGNMSEREYKLQRKYAESFPILDTSELEKQLLSSNLADAELNNFFGNSTEGKNETK